VQADKKRGPHRYLWYDHDSAVRALRQHGTSAKDTVERLTNTLLEHFAADLFVETFPDCADLYIEAPGKPPTPLQEPQPSRKTEAHSTRSISALAADLESFSTTTEPSTKDRTGIIQISRFAMVQVRENDLFKRFLWCYAGLELMANKLYSSLKPQLARSLAIRVGEETVSGHAAQQLLWPAPSDSASDPWRSITFKFSMMAVLLSPTTADEDVEKFKVINRYRNGIHGSLLFPLVPPVSTAIELFEKYYAVARERLPASRPRG
jgi:hypothetical protein